MTTTDAPSEPGPELARDADAATELGPCAHHAEHCEVLNALCLLDCFPAGRAYQDQRRQAAAEAAEDQPVMGHVGWPVDTDAALARMKRGLPVYWPDDPKLIDQRPYLAFAGKRPPNSE